MTVTTEIKELFRCTKLSFDLKHYIYKMLWMHVYPINPSLKNDLLSTSYLMSILNRIKHSINRKVVVESMNMEIIDNTHYLNNVLYNLYILPSTPTTILLNFKIYCSFHLDQDDEENDMIRVLMSLDIDSPYYMSDDEKLTFIKHLWSHIDFNTKTTFFKHGYQSSVPVTDMFLQSILTEQTIEQ